MRSAFTSVFLLVALAWVVSGCSSSKVNVNETPESVGERFYELLVSNDSEGLKELFPQAKDWESMAKITMVPENKMDEFKEDFMRRIEMTTTNEVSRFGILQERVKTLGLDLAEAELDEVAKVREWMDEGLNLASVEIRFHIADDKHTIFLGNIGQLERGWFMNRVPNWKPGSKNEGN